MNKESTCWYKDAVIYEVRVRSFFDANGDGSGDFQGLTQKLDYLQDLGITALWLLPFYPSPLRDDGYDIADYRSVHPDYGSLHDFKVFLREAHRRDLKVITELVLNHTSDQHEWFQRARREGPRGPYRDFYVWSDSPQRYSDARVIFQDFETSNWTWDPVAKAYYWHRFYSHQPDLNFDHPAVRKEMLRVVDFWLNLGVDGLRLDAVPYLFEREETNCENLPETHEFLRTLRQHIDERFPNRMLLAEANLWPEDAIAYFGANDECHMTFHFPIMPRMYMSLHMEDRFPLLDTLQQTPAIDPSCQWAIFLRNHDELTLETVTDEERQYMYRVYAPDLRARINQGIRRRLAPLLGNNRRKLELMNGLLLSLPGTPVLYYGDEIGMGDNIFLNDRNGVRTPMQWSSDRNAGFSRANPQRLPLPVITDPEYHYETINVESQQNNPTSLLWWMKRVIALRKQFKAFGRGAIEYLLPANPKILVFVRHFEGETVLVVANLSRFSQYVELNLTKFKGSPVVELFGNTVFPLITELPYPLSLGPHSFYWFSIEPSQDPGVSMTGGGTALPEATVKNSWLQVLTPPHRRWLERLLPQALEHRRWFGSEKRRIKNLSIIEELAQKEWMSDAAILFLRVDYVDGGDAVFVMCLQFVPDALEGGGAPVPPASLARLHIQDSPSNRSGYLVDGFGDLSFLKRFLTWVEQHRQIRGHSGFLTGVRSDPDAGFLLPEQGLEPHLLLGQQNNSLARFGECFILKTYRRIEPGVSPDYETIRFLTERAHFPSVPRVRGAVEYHPAQGEPWTLAVVQDYVANQGTAWDYALDQVQGFFELALAHPQESQLSNSTDWTQELMAPSMANIRLLGQRTAELHRALGCDTADLAFAPEPFTIYYQKAIAQAMRSISARALAHLRDRLSTLPDDVKGQAERVLQSEAQMGRVFRSLVAGRLDGARLRIHGDFHLEQVLFTGKDFVFLDFEGDPTRPISERRIRRSPLRDVAGMLRSLHYVAHTALTRRTRGPIARPEDQPRITHWAEVWRRRAGDEYLESYRSHIQSTGYLPTSTEDQNRLLQAFLLEKACGEVSHELTHRPDWVGIPLLGILDLLHGER